MPDTYYVLFTVRINLVERKNAESKKCRKKKYRNCIIAVSARAFYI
jgi:hypothetical protein